MKLRAHYFLVAVAGVGMSSAARADEPSRLPLNQPQTRVAAIAAGTNQQVAERIAQQLRKQPGLRQYSIDIAVKDGVVELHGNVGDIKQREQAQQIAMSTIGVTKVLDSLTIGAIQPVSAVQDTGLQPSPLPGSPLPVGQFPPTQLPPASPVPSAPMRAVPIPQLNPAPGAPSAPMAEIQPGRPGMPQTVFGEPQGGMEGMGGAPQEMGTPPLPSYAWPTYAPYNNYSRVAYPQAYPACAWPFIGPYYPFPRVPPGWRSVKLEWQDGHWWFSKTATKYDYWRVRFW